MALTHGGVVGITQYSGIMVVQSVGSDAGVLARRRGRVAAACQLSNVSACALGLVAHARAK